MNAHEDPLAGLRTTPQKLVMVAVLLLVFIFLVAGIHYAFKDNTPGIDFYVYWRAGRAFFLEKRDPYSEEVTALIQSGIYHNREALPGEDPMKFNNPPFALLPVLPFLPIRFDWAQAGWMALNILCLIIMAHLSYPRAPGLLVLSLPFYYPVAFGLILGNFAILIFAGLVWVLSRLQSKKPITVPEQVVMGVILAWASAKPQMVWLYVLLVVLTSLRLKSFYVLISYLGSLVLLCGLMFLFRSDWLSGWIQHIQSFSQFHPSAPCRQFFLERVFPSAWTQFAWTQFASCFLQVLLAALFVLAFFLWAKQKITLPMMLSWCSLAIIFIHPVCISYDQVVLLIPVFFWVAQAKKRSCIPGVVWGAGLILLYLFFPASSRFELPWMVNQMPIVLYLFWMVVLHLEWIFHRKAIIQQTR